MRNRKKMPRTRCGGRLLAILLVIVTLLALICVTGVPVMAEESGMCGENLTWTLTDDGTLTIEGSGEMGEYYGSWPWEEQKAQIKKIVLPEGITSIGEGAFHNCDGLTELSIPASVTSIGERAFTSCANLNTVTVAQDNAVYRVDGNCIIEKETGMLIAGCNQSIIPTDGSVKGIGDFAFWYCDGLAEVTIPASVTSIGRSAFGGCKALNTITAEPGNDVYLIEGNCIIEKETGMLIAGCNQSVIPTDGSVKGIGEFALYGFDGLTELAIPDSVTSIGQQAISYCNGLTELTIPDSVTSIEFAAFWGNAGLTKVTLPKNIESISGTFYDCTSLAEITIPASVTSIERNPFSGCTALNTVTVDPDNPVYRSEGNCIIDKSSGTLVVGCSGSVIPTDGSVQCIGESAFGGRTGLTELTIPEGVTSIEDYAFSGCTGLTEVTIPESVTSIGGSAFSECTSLTEITVPAGVTSIWSGTFSGCTALNTITVASGNAVYRSDGNCIIEKETGLLVAGCNHSIIPTDGSVKDIGRFAFFDCTGLTEITIPDSVTSIGERAFSGCTGLQSIAIPDSVTKIEGNIFADCTQSNLVIYCEQETQPQTWDENWLKECAAAVHWGETPPPSVDPDNPSGADGTDAGKSGGSHLQNPLLWVAIALAVVIALGIVLAIVLLRKKKSAPAAPAQDPQNPPQT